MNPEDALKGELKRRRRAERKAAKANGRADFYKRMLERELARHREDVTFLFNSVLSYELQGRPLPAREMPDILSLTVDEERGAMWWEPTSPAIEAWVEKRLLEA